MYRIREVNGNDEDVADTLAELHHLTFFQSAPFPEFDWGHWWLAYYVWRCARRVCRAGSVNAC
jgi:hypothetical protein